jgi:hypothetical protein
MVLQPQVALVGRAVGCHELGQRDDRVDADPDVAQRTDAVGRRAGVEGLLQRCPGRAEGDERRRDLIGRGPDENPSVGGREQPVQR